MESKMIELETWQTLQLVPLLERMESLGGTLIAQVYQDGIVVKVLDKEQSQAVRNVLHPSPDDVDSHGSAFDRMQANK